MSQAPAFYADTLQVRDLSTGYRDRQVIQNLSLPPIRPGEVHSLLGPNAAGKSTLLRALAGLQPATGSIRLGRQELVGLPLAEHARRVTYMPQTLPQGVALSVLESVLGALQASATDRPGEHQGRAGHEADQCRAVAVLERVGILRWRGWTTCLAGSGSWCRWRSRWCASRACCCWTSPSARSICSTSCA